jgi:hypothetical protein
MWQMAMLMHVCAHIYIYILTAGQGSRYRTEIWIQRERHWKAQEDVRRRLIKRWITEVISMWQQNSVTVSAHEQTLSRTDIHDEHTTKIKHAKCWSVLLMSANVHQNMITLHFIPIPLNFLRHSILPSSQCPNQTTHEQLSKGKSCLTNSMETGILQKRTDSNGIQHSDFVHRPEFEITRKHSIMFWKLDLFLSSGEGRETPTLLGPLERPSLNHWTTHII